MSQELTKEDLKKFEEFEKTILNLKDSSVRYKRDDEMEVQIKKEVLYSNFGKDKVDQILEKLKVNFTDLIDHKVYIEIYKFLDS
jgi:hypothetical protein